MGFGHRVRVIEPQVGFSLPALGRFVDSERVPQAKHAEGWSVLGYVLIVSSMLGLALLHALLSWAPVVIGIQVLAVGLMLWGRFTFGLRSFHATASPTAGGIVTTGPYRFIRHPLYTSICLFAWPAVLANLSPVTVLLGAVMTCGALLRMRCEEVLLVRRYPEYAEYSAHTKRMIPGVF